MSIPPQARKVFSGVIFDVYQWEQEVFDGTMRTWEMLKRNDSATVIAIVDNCVLVLDEEQPHHGRHVGLPGGIVDDGESPLAAAKRELLEETGYASDDWKLLKEFRPGFKTDWVDHVYIARDCRKVADAKPEPGEKIAVLLQSSEEFMKTILDEDFRNKLVALELLRLENQGISFAERCDRQ